MNMFLKKNKSTGLTQEIRVKRCYGCGAILQDQDPNEVGYVPPEKFACDEETLCERCYKLRHYSTFKKSPDFNLDYVTILSKAKEEEALIVYVLNAFCLTGSILEGIGKYLPKNVLVLINKRDVLPKSYSDEFLKELVTERLFKDGIRPRSIILTSASSKNYNISEVMKEIERLRNGKSVYFIGAYQVGKSSLINCLLMDYTNSTDKMITTSPYPGTTLDVISIPLDEESYIYDTPGIYNSKSIISYIEPEKVKYIIPRNEIRPESFLSKPGQSFLIGNLARLDFDKGSKTLFTFFKSNDLILDRVKTNKADNYIASVANDPDREYCSQKIKSVDDLEKHQIKAEKDKIRILIVGLGFISFEGLDQEITVYAPKGVEVLVEKGGQLI